MVGVVLFFAPVLQGLWQDPWMTGADLSGGPFSLPLLFHRNGEQDLGAAERCLHGALRGSAPCLLEKYNIGIWPLRV